MQNLWLPVAALTIAAVSIGCGETPTTPSPPPPPAVLLVTSVTPSTGSPSVPTPIRINGTGFLSEAIVRLDDVPTTTTFVSSTVLTAVAPPHALGPIDVVVINPAGESSRLERGFTYVRVLTSVAIGGNTALGAIGETSQLTANAVFSDGTTDDVTAVASWETTDPQIAVVSTAGVLTAMGLGSTTVIVRYFVPGRQLVRSAPVSVTPPGTFSIAGRVREPGGENGAGNGTGGLAGASVRHMTSGVSVLTGEFGAFTFGGLTDGRLAVSKDGFEPVELVAVPDSGVNVPLQRVVRIEAGSAPQSRTLAPNDVEYEPAPGTRCQPCRLIRITSDTPDTVLVRLTWSSAVDLHVWVNGQMFAAASRSVRVVEASVPVMNGETIIYVGAVAGPSFVGHQAYVVTVTPGG